MNIKLKLMLAGFIIGVVILAWLGLLWIGTWPAIVNSIFPMAIVLMWINTSVFEIEIHKLLERTKVSNP